MKKADLLYNFKRALKGMNVGIYNKTSLTGLSFPLEMLVM